MSKKKDLLDYIKPLNIKAPKDEFFAKLSMNIVQDGIRARSTRFQKRQRFIQFSYATAALFLIGFVLFQQFNYMPIQNKSVDTYLAALSPNDILEYVENNIEDYSEDELIDASAPITEEEMESITFTEVFGYIPEEIETEAIEQYLDEDFINLNDFDENELLIF